MIQVLAWLHEPELSQFRMERLAALDGVTVTTARNLAEAAPALAEAEVLITIGPHLDADAAAAFAAAPRLRYVQSIGTGTDNLTDHPALGPDVAVCNVHGIHGAQLSEAALAAMLGFSRGMPRAFAAQQARRWDKYPANLLHGKTVGIFGLGAIASALAPRCAALGMRIVGISGTARAVPGFDRVYARSDLIAAVAQLDYLVLLTPLTAETRHIVNAPVLAAMRPHAVLVNLARGGVVDEAALLEALTTGRIAGAALDVFETEPLPADHPFWALDNVMISPHSAGFHTGYADDAFAIIAANLRNYVAGGVPALINRVQ